MGHRAAHPASFEGSPSSESGGVVSRPPSPGAKWMDQGEVGRVGQQSPGEVLRTYHRWSQVSGGGTVQLGKTLGRHWTGPGNVLTNEESSVFVQNDTATTEN